MSGLSNGQQALMMLTAFLVPLLASIASWSALGMPTDRTAIGMLVAAICGDLSAGIIVFAKEILGGKAPETAGSTTSPPVTSMTKLRFFMSQFIHDKTGRGGFHKRRSRSGRYDPDPHPGRRNRGPRKGVEPSGLRRWRLAHRTHDPHPGNRRSLWRGPRGGHYFHGPRKNRYDPAPPRRHRFRSGAGRVGRGIEGIFNKYGIAIGGLIGGIAGFYKAYSDYNTAYGPNALKNYWSTLVGGPMLGKANEALGTRTPEISKLWGTNDYAWSAPRGPLDYLKYKFLGQDLGGGYKGSAWVYPFWIGFGATILKPLVGLFTHKGQSILKPLQKVGIGMLTVSTAGALALPGCPKKGDVANVLPPPPNTQKPNVVQFTLGQNS